MSTDWDTVLYDTADLLGLYHYYDSHAIVSSQTMDQFWTFCHPGANQYPYSINIF